MKSKLSKKKKGATMTIAELRAYRDNIQKIESIQLRLDKRKVVAVTQGSAGPPTYKKVTKKEYGYIYHEDNFSLQAKKARLEFENEKIDEFICSIPKKRFRDALTYYCLNLDVSDPTWQETAEAVKDKADGEALRKATDRYLKKF